jgi:hypothetical protein
MGITGGQPALMYARARSAGGTGLYRAPRAGATRSNYFGPNLCLSVNGTNRHFNFDRETWRVTERARGGQPGQLSIDLFGFTPAAAQEVIFGAGALTNRLFRGTIVRVNRQFTRLDQGRTIYRCTCLDWLYQLQGILVTKRYATQTATAIALDLLSTYAPTGFTTTTYVQTGLATIDEIQFTLVPLAAAFEQLAERIGGYDYWDFDKQLHLYTTETTGVGPEAITTSNPHTQSLTYDSDTEGVRNRIVVEGLGASVRAPIAVGGTTIPVDDISAFATSGTNSAKLEAQILTYTGVAAGSEAGSATGYLSAPVPTLSATGTGGALTPNATYLVGLTYQTSAGESNIVNTLSVSISGAEDEFFLNIAVPTDPKVTLKSLYMSDAGGGVGTLKKYTDIAIATATAHINALAVGAAPPSSNTAGYGASSVAAGATAIEVEDLSQFPASGWAEAPGGQVFSYTGRSASSGSGTLTGIPASGVGSLTATVRSGTVKAIPHLTGVPASGAGAIAQALKVGEAINILVITEDATSKSTYGTREHPVQDRRLNLAGAGARGAAVLALLKDPRTSGSCTSSDPKLRARRPLTITVAEWGLSITVTVQSVTIRPEPNRPQPMADVQFASRSLEDLFVTLREIKERALIR